MKLFGFLKNILTRHSQVLHSLPEDNDQHAVVFYSQFIHPGDLCFDVGANIGNRTELFLQLGAKVVSVEPQSACIRALRQRFGRNPNFILIPEALGSQPGKVEMYINSRENTISSFSKEWIDTVKQSGRFSGYLWNRKQVVKVNTLNHLIDKHGIPRFIKIDVEGYEYEVLKGLSKTVRGLSFEFTPEFLGTGIKCIKHLESLGEICLNYSLGESMQMALPEWVNSDKVIAELSKYQGDNRIFGDIYVKFVK